MVFLLDKYIPMGLITKDRTKPHNGGIFLIAFRHRYRIIKNSPI